jgi:hypothetical protein
MNGKNHWKLFSNDFQLVSVGFFLLLLQRFAPYGAGGIQLC